MNRLATLIAVCLFLRAVVAPAFAADDSSLHKLWLDSTEGKKTFVAKIDGRQFTTLTSLEDYIAALPSGDRVRCRFDGGKVFVENPDVPTLKRYSRTLQKFCRDHQLGFTVSIIYL